MAEAEALARRDPELLPDDVDPRHHLRHRMLDLQPGVHLEEVEVPVAVHEELHGPGVDVADGRGQPAGRLAHARAHGLVHERRRRFLDELLVAPLDRALALAEVDDGAVGIGEDLDLDVAWLGEVALDVDGAVAEGGDGLRPRQAQRRAELAFLPHEPHPLAAPTHRGLDHHGVAHLASQAGGFGLVRDRACRARHDRHLQPGRDAAGRGLVRHGPHRRRRRADERQTGRHARLGELRVLAEEPVPGMDGVGAGGLRDVDDTVDREVARRGLRRTDRVRLVGHAHVEGLAVGVREHRHRGEPGLAAGANHPDRDLSPVGDQNLVDATLSARSRKPWGGRIADALSAAGSPTR